MIDIDLLKDVIERLVRIESGGAETCRQLKRINGTVGDTAKLLTAHLENHRIIDVEAKTRAAVRAEDKARVMGFIDKANDWKALIIPLFGLGLLVGKFGIEGLWGWFV